MFFQADCAVEVQKAGAMENQVGVFLMVLHPDGFSNTFERKPCKLTDSLIVGTTQHHDPNVDKLDTTVSKCCPTEYSGQKKKLNGPGVANKSFPIILRQFFLPKLY